MDVEYGCYYYDIDDIDDIDDCDRDVDCLRRIISKYIINKYNVNDLHYVADKDLEDKFRDVLRNYTVVQIRSLCKRMKVRKVSGLKKLELIEAIISWIMEHRSRECELRSIGQTNLLRLVDHFGIAVGFPLDIDEVINQVLEVIDKRNADWRWIFEFE